MTTNKKLDPKQLFTISTISRADIAGLLNDAIDATASNVKKFTKDDPRLTDAVCQSAANTMHDFAEEDHDTYDSDEAACRAVLSNWFSRR